MSVPSSTAPCKRGCCWTPWSPEVCGRKWHCRCHQIKSLDDLLASDTGKDKA